MHCTVRRALPLPFSAAEQFGRPTVPVSQSAIPAGGQERTVQPVPPSPPNPKQFEKPEKPFTSNSPEPPTSSMLPPGRLTRTEQDPLWVPTTVPLGHSAGSKDPPSLLLMLKVKVSLAQSVVEVELLVLVVLEVLVVLLVELLVLVVLEVLVVLLVELLVVVLPAIVVDVVVLPPMIVVDVVVLPPMIVVDVVVGGGGHASPTGRGLQTKVNLSLSVFFLASRSTLPLPGLSPFFFDFTGTGKSMKALQAELKSPGRVEDTSSMKIGSSGQRFHGCIRFSLR
jgi:hypothetical protein